MDEELERRVAIIAGDVLCAINSVKTLPPDALSALAREIDQVRPDDALRFVRVIRTLQVH